MKTKPIHKIVTGSYQVDGAGVKLVRVIGYRDVKDFDPFLMLDAFDSENPDDYTKGFPWHPHRGIETVTYLVNGNIEHGDSLGNKGNIEDGSCQWMTAGSGIIHQEMPQASQRMLGVQLWVNLPKKDKMTNPQYRNITSDQIPEIKEDGSVVRVISGKYRQAAGATQGDYVKVLALDVALKKDVEWSLVVPADETLFIYIFEGLGYLGEDMQQIESHRSILFGQGEEFRVKSGSDDLRFVLFSGRPLKEPIAWGGPIVMNTEEELEKAFQEIDEGTFIK
jgi:redox-sensitive bicupin YhaK (pirin superfamily)